MRALLLAVTLALPALAGAHDWTPKDVALFGVCTQGRPERIDACAKFQAAMQARYRNLAEVMKAARTTGLDTSDPVVAAVPWMFENP